MKIGKKVEGWEYEDRFAYETWTYEWSDGYVRLDHNYGHAFDNRWGNENRWVYTTHKMDGFAELPENDNVKTLEDRLAFILTLARLED